MPGKKSKPRRRERIKEYYKERYEINVMRKKMKEEKRKEYFANRRTRFALEIPEAVKEFLTNAIINSYVSRLNEKTYRKLIHELGTKLSVEKNLPKGRIKQELRQHLPKP